MTDEKTLGELLRHERHQRGESLEQVHERTGIGVKVLASLEEGTVGVVELVYLRLALTSYGEYLGLGTDELLALFDRDHGSHATTPRRPPAPLVPTSTWRHELGIRLRRLSPMWLGGAFAVLLLAIILLIVYLRRGDTTAATGAGRPGQGGAPPPAAAPIRARPIPVAASATDNPPAAPRPSSETPPPADRPAADRPAADRPAADRPAEAPTARQSPEPVPASPFPAPATAPAVATPEEIVATEDLAAADEATAETPAQIDLPPPPRPAGAAAPTEATAEVAAEVVAEVVAEVAAEVAAETEPQEVTRQRGDLEALAAGVAVVVEGLAVDSTWVQVQWDGRGTSEEIIPRGERRTWAGRDSVLVRAGRAHGIRFSYQGRLLGDGRLGDPTKVLRLRADHGGVVLLGADLEPLSRVALPPDSTATETDPAGP